MTACVVVRCVLLACDQLLRMEKLAVRTCPDLVCKNVERHLTLDSRGGRIQIQFTDNCWLQVNKNGTRNVFPCASLREECVERIVTSSDSFVGGHLAVRLDAVFKAVQLPACIANLYTSLAYVNRDALALKKCSRNEKRCYMLVVSMLLQN